LGFSDGIIHVASRYYFGSSSPLCSTFSLAIDSSSSSSSSQLNKKTDKQINWKISNADQKAKE
jgi:hypothetical protein